MWEWHIIYSVFILLITFYVLYLYYAQTIEYNREMERIESIEQRKLQKQRELENIRSMTQSCPINNLNDPRSCYIKSDYKCKWNELADRCDNNV